MSKTRDSSLIKSILSSVGWLNPFNNRGNIFRRILGTSFALLNYTAKTAGNTCFQDIGEQNYYNIDCPPSLERKLMHQFTTHCNVTSNDAILCPDYYQYIFNYGRAFFGEALCVFSSSSDHPNTCVTQTLQENAVSGYGTDTDVLATIGLGVGGLAVMVIVTCGICYFRQPEPVVEDERPISIHDKYDPLTHALAENDAALLFEINEMAHDVECGLPWEILNHIVRLMPGYDDRKYRYLIPSDSIDEIIEMEDAQPTLNSPDQDDISKLNGRFIRFFDTHDRVNVRNKTLLDALTEIRKQRQSSPLLGEVSYASEEYIPLLSVQSR